MNNAIVQKSAKLQFSKPRQGQHSLVPEQKEYEQNYILHRVKLGPIEISEVTRDGVLEAMKRGDRFVQLGDYTVMVNSITGIDPLPIKRKPSDISELPEISQEEWERNQKKLDEIRAQLR